VAVGVGVLVGVEVKVAVGLGVTVGVLVGVLVGAAVLMAAFGHFLTVTRRPFTIFVFFVQCLALGAAACVDVAYQGIGDTAIPDASIKSVMTTKRRTGPPPSNPS